MKIRVLLKQMAPLLLIGLLLIFLATVPSISDVFAAINPLSGDYYGSVTVDSPSGMGNIDLAFHLEVKTDGTINTSKSYIILDKTVLFPKVGNKVGGKDAGPRVKSGKLTPTAFSLTTESFYTTVAERKVTRGIALKNGKPSQGNTTLAGTYVETLTGVYPKPMQITGRVTLVRPIPATEGLVCCEDLDKSGDLSLAVIRAGGKEAYTVEFEDVSCAMSYYRGLRNGKTVSPATMAAAIDEYRKYLSR